MLLLALSALVALLALLTLFALRAQGPQAAPGIALTQALQALARTYAASP